MSRKAPLAMPGEAIRVVAMMAAAALSLLACGAPPSAPDDLIGQLRAGRVMCMTPSTSGKRCNSMGRYTFHGDGNVRAETNVTMSKSVVMSTTSPVTLRGAAICFSPQEQNIDGATFVVSGNPATAEQTSTLRATLKSRIAARPAQEFCMKLALREGRLMTDVTVDNIPHPELSEAVIWINADDGYSVGPD